VSYTPKGWLLDTSILVHLGRESPRGRHVIDHHQLRARSEAPFISCVSVGEIMSLERQFGWGDGRVIRMREILAELVIVDINSEPVLSAYAELDHRCHQNGRVLGKDDLWIAATAVIMETLLLTTDKDFDALHGRFLQRDYFDPDATYPAA
jgi:tRNA(fMet)-specific endonuclease VapC